MDELELENTEFGTFINSIKTLIDIEDENLTDEVRDNLIKRIDENFSSPVMTQSINQVVQNLENQGLTREEAKESVNNLKNLIKELIYQDEVYSTNKKAVVDFVITKLFDVFDFAVEKYHSYAIELPMTLDTGAKEPTYAHDTDAAADLYAREDQIIPAHSYGNMIKTGVKIQLPEGWLAMILPRSSMGVKTPLRLSNSVGLIDSGYRGELGVIYDNTSDNDYSITAGDRIAQLLVMPSYRFQAKVVDILTDSDRGEGGFGASGK